MSARVVPNAYKVLLTIMSKDCEVQESSWSSANSHDSFNSNFIPSSTFLPSEGPSSRGYDCLGKAHVHKASPDPSTMVVPIDMSRGSNQCWKHDNTTLEALNLFTPTIPAGCISTRPSHITASGALIYRRSDTGTANLLEVKKTSSGLSPLELSPCRC